MKFELDYIERLVQLVAENNLTEIALEEDEKAIVIRREKEIITTQVAQAAPVTVSAQAPVAATPSAPVAESPAKRGTPVTSPMVGTFYKASAPGAVPFIEIGKTVSAGQVVCIIEAMKLMNEIESEVSGKVIEICVQDGQPVEYGQVLMLIEA